MTKCISVYNCICTELLLPLPREQCLLVDIKLPNEIIMCAKLFN